MHALHVCILIALGCSKFLALVYLIHYTIRVSLGGLLCCFFFFFFKPNILCMF